MELYQKIVLGIAIVLLISAYIMIYFTLVDNNKHWPPSVAKCPDYWVYDALNNECKSTNNTFNTGENNINTYSLLQKSDCDKYKWAKQNNISWEGLSYGVSMDCNN